MNKFLTTIGFTLALVLSASAASFKSHPLLPGRSVMFTNATTWTYATANVPYEDPMLAGAGGLTPFVSWNGTNAPSGCYFASNNLTPAFNVAFSQSAKYFTWTNNATVGAWNTSTANATNTSTAGYWTQDAFPICDGYGQVSPMTLTFGLAGTSLKSSNTVAITLVKSTFSTNFNILGPESFTITVTNGQAATGIPVATTPTYWSTNLPTAFITNARRIRIYSIVASDVGAAASGAVFDAGISQWVP